MVHTNPAESGRWCWNKSQRRNRGTPPQPCAAACPRTGQKHFQSKMPRIGQNLRQFATIRLILSQNLLTLPAEHKVQSDSATRPVWSEYLSTNNRSTSPLSSAVLDVMEPSSGLMVPLSGAHRRRRQQKSGEKKRGTWATNGRPKRVRGRRATKEWTRTSPPGSPCRPWHCRSRPNRATSRFRTGCRSWRTSPLAPGRTFLARTGGSHRQRRCLRLLRRFPRRNRCTRRH